MMRSTWLRPVSALAGRAAGQPDQREAVVRSAPGAPLPSRESAAGARGWTLDVSASPAFDSNPTLTPEDDVRAAGAGGFIGAIVNGSYRLHRAGPWTLTASGMGIWSKPFEASGVSATALRPSLAVDYAFAAGRVPVAGIE